MSVPTGLEFRPGTPRSISDDDLCSDCLHCWYDPGLMSGCRRNWPATFDRDGYVVACREYLEVAHQGENWVHPLEVL